MFREQLEQIENAGCGFAVTPMTFSCPHTMPVFCIHSKSPLDYNSAKHNVTSNKKQEMEVKL